MSSRSVSSWTKANQGVHIVHSLGFTTNVQLLYAQTQSASQRLACTHHSRILATIQPASCKNSMSMGRGGGHGIEPDRSGVPMQQRRQLKPGCAIRSNFPKRSTMPTCALSTQLQMKEGVSVTTPRSQACDRRQQAGTAHLKQTPIVVFRVQGFFAMANFKHKCLCASGC